MTMWKWMGASVLLLGGVLGAAAIAQAEEQVQAEDQVTSTEPLQVECEIFVAGGGFGGVATAYDALRLGRTVCMTEITDWIGGQVSAQGVSALDERPLQRGDVTGETIFPSGYDEFRDRVRDAYDGDPNPGRCWVSVLCFSPQVGHQVLVDMLQPYVESGQLHLFVDTVVSDVETEDNLVTAVQAIRHSPTRPELEGGQRGDLSDYFLEWYDPEPSADWDKQLITFVPPGDRADSTVPWMVVDATETGELWPLADVPYLLGTDNIATYWEPSAKDEVAPYCTQGFTYTFAMERTATPQYHVEPEFYNSADHGRYYSFEQERFDFAAVFTYRRIVPGASQHPQY